MGDVTVKGKSIDGSGTTLLVSTTAGGSMALMILADAADASISSGTGSSEGAFGRNVGSLLSVNSSRKRLCDVGEEGLISEHIDVYSGHVCKKFILGQVVGDAPVHISLDDSVQESSVTLADNNGSLGNVVSDVEGDGVVPRERVANGGGDGGGKGDENGGRDIASSGSGSYDQSLAWYNPNIDISTRKYTSANSSPLVVLVENTRPARNVRKLDPICILDLLFHLWVMAIPFQIVKSNN